MTATARKVSDSTLRRLSLYLRYLESLEEEGVATVSSDLLACHTRTTAAQVRKDLSHFGSFGKRGFGYPVSELARRLRGILGLTRPYRVALVGAGRVGSALFAYEEFRRRGFHIVAVVDADPRKAGRRMGDVVVRPAGELEAVLREEAVDIAILAVPVPAVQEVLDRVARAGVRAVLNFAPTELQVPEGVTVREVNMVVEMEGLSFVLAGEGAGG